MTRILCKPRIIKYFRCLGTEMLALVLIFTSITVSFQAALAQPAVHSVVPSATHGDHHTYYDHNPSSENHHQSAVQQAFRKQRCPLPSIGCPCIECQDYFLVHFVTLLYSPLSIVTIDPGCASKADHFDTPLTRSSPPPTPPPIYI